MTNPAAITGFCERHQNARKEQWLSAAVVNDAYTYIMILDIFTLIMLWTNSADDKHKIFFRRK